MQLILKPNILVSDSIKEKMAFEIVGDKTNYSVASNYSGLAEAPVKVLRMDLNMRSCIQTEWQIHRIFFWEVSLVTN